jgi:hypothetical protein
VKPHNKDITKAPKGKKPVRELKRSTIKKIWRNGALKKESICGANDLKTPLIANGNNSPP